MWSYVPLEHRIPSDHPLRPLRAMVETILGELSPQFDQLYSKVGRPSIPPEHLLRALLLQVLYSVRSERLLMEQLDYNLLFRWFVGLAMDDPIWDGIALGNLTLDVSRKSGFYPDIVMGGPDPLRQLRKLGVIEPQARFFSKNRGLALLVRKGNPLGIHGLTDVARSGARLALPDVVEEAGSRARYRAAVDQLIGKSATDAFFAAEVPHFRGRIGIVHRDFPEMIARGYADVALTQHHLISYWTRIFPNHFELVAVSGAERFFLKIAFGRVVDPLRPRALRAFDEFFFSRARDAYPRYDLARMTDDEYGAALALD